LPPARSRRGPSTYEETEDMTVKQLLAPKLRYAAVFVAAFLTLAAFTPGLASAEEAAKGPKTLFDASHTEIFSPVKEGPLHYGYFYKMFSEKGGAGVNEGRVTPRALDGVKTYVIAGPAGEFTRDDIVVLQSFVRSGGNLLVLLHIAPPVARLTESFGIILSNFVVAEQENIIEGEVQDFLVKDFTHHPVTRGLKSVAVYGSWGLMAEIGSRARVLATTSEGSWADLNRNRTREDNEPLMKYGIIAAAEYGSGKVVVVADDAPFANKFIDEADNRRLASNIVEWFSK